MGIEKGADSLLTFEIKKSSTHPNVTLPKFEEYLNFLNESELADCLINRLGMVTENDIHGSFAQAENGKFRVIPGKEFNPIIYRGQNNDYPFMPSSKRYELFDGNERIRHSIEWIKKNEFLRLIKTTPYIKRAQKFKVLDFTYDIDMEAVAKHYELVSDYLDVTRDMMTALFFAYTYFDKDKGQLLPLPAFEYNNPYIYIGNIRNLYYKAPDSVKRIGFQPLPRAKAQQSMSINVSGDFEYIKTLFKKIELPKNPAIAKYVYNTFEGGKLLFPDDYASKFAEKIKANKTLQGDLFVRYCEETKTDKIWLSGELKKLGYTLGSLFPETERNVETTINKEVDEYILPFLDDGIIFRGIKL